jgi:metal-dependent hydrolase (beta-lactamase superfamily II)
MTTFVATPAWPLDTPKQLDYKDTFKVENVAPGHCTGEPTFAALKQAFGNRYIYAGVGTSLPLGPSTGAGEQLARDRYSKRTI